MRAWTVASASALACAGACTFDGLDTYTAGSDASGGDSAPFDAAKDGPVSDQSVSDVVVEAPPPPCNLGAPFGTATPVSSLDTSRLEGQAALSPDELTVYFMSDRLNTGSNVFTASRPNKSGVFGSVAPLASLNFAGADTWNVALTGDGLTAYIVTDQNAANHMYVTTRASSLASFGTPALMPSPIVTGEQPFVRPDGQVLYYSDHSGAKGQIARAVIAGPTVSMVSLAVPGNHDLAIPVINPTETLIYFAVFDSINFDSYDIWMATRATANDPWSTPAPVTELNTSSFDVPSWVSADGCTLYFTHAPALDAGGSWDIYSARRP